MKKKFIKLKMFFIYAQLYMYEKKINIMIFIINKYKIYKYYDK